jgi:cell division protein ZapA
MARMCKSLRKAIPNACAGDRCGKVGFAGFKWTKEGWAMAQIVVVVNGRSFRMGCREGEEGRVQDLAAEIDAHVQRIKSGTKAVQDDRLFLMAAIMMADQLWDVREEMQRLQRLAGDLRAYHVIDGGAQAMQRDLSKALEASGKIETLHQRAGGGS